MITSAPRSASRAVDRGPASTRVKSRMRMPSRGSVAWEIVVAFVTSEGLFYPAPVVDHPLPGCVARVAAAHEVDEPAEDNIIPSVFDERLVPSIAAKIV